MVVDNESLRMTNRSTRDARNRATFQLSPKYAQVSKLAKLLDRESSVCGFKSHSEHQNGSVAVTVGIPTIKRPDLVILDR